mmetsp:Transcript_13422/g.25715  ORF Transcript_13422/g.25715 Transcript_13422/m.25715 type:complete len:83 (-) Transcript_13422:161-409(-)
MKTKQGRPAMNTCLLERGNDKTSLRLKSYASVTEAFFLLTMFFFVTSLKGFVGSRDGETVGKVRTAIAVAARGGLGAENFIQ